MKKVETKIFAIFKIWKVIKITGSRQNYILNSPEFENILFTQDLELIKSIMRTSVIKSSSFPNWICKCICALNIVLIETMESTQNCTFSLFQVSVVFHVCVDVYVSVHVYLYACMYVHICEYVGMCMCLCAHACVCLFTERTE